MRGLSVDVASLGHLFHHGGRFYTLQYRRCGHTAAVVAAWTELDRVVTTYYSECQQCARPIHWVCPGCAVILSPNTVITEADPASGDLVTRCSSCGTDAWG